MKTRTLLLLSVATGLAILLAGGIQLVRVTNQSELVPSYEMGEAARVGDMTVVVEASDEADGVLRVQLSIGGVDDPDGAGGFQLVVPGDGVIQQSTRRDDPGSCGATTVDAAICEITFDVGGTGSDVRTLRYGRGEDSARWLLGGS